MPGPNRPCDVLGGGGGADASSDMRHGEEKNAHPKIDPKPANKQ
jgi:hypothetical protein